MVPDVTWPAWRPTHALGLATTVGRIYGFCVGLGGGDGDGDGVGDGGGGGVGSLVGAGCLLVPRFFGMLLHLDKVSIGLLHLN